MHALKPLQSQAPDPRLLREGIEALPVVVGTIAFLKKAGRSEVLPHVHAGWISALAAGGLTWAVATYVVGISGASREVTEGASSLFAAVVLLGVGVWMHQKSSAGRWQACLRDKLSTAVSLTPSPDPALHPTPSPRGCFSDRLTLLFPQLDLGPAFSHYGPDKLDRTNKALKGIVYPVQCRGDRRRFCS